LDTVFGHSFWSLAMGLWLDSFPTGFTFHQNFENSPQGLPPEAETMRHERELNLSQYIIDNNDMLSSRKYITQKIIYRQF
jgi:hypothetical protein